MRTPRWLAIATALTVLVGAGAVGAAGADVVHGGASPDAAVALGSLGSPEAPSPVAVTNLDQDPQTSVGEREGAVAQYWDAVAWYSIQPETSFVGTVQLTAGSGRPTLEVWGPDLLGQVSADPADPGPELVLVTEPLTFEAGEQYLVGYGTGDASQGSGELELVPLTPQTPTDLTAVAGDGEATLTWTAPPAAGQVEYRVLCGDEECATTDTASATVALPNGEAAELRVVASNLTGSSEPTEPVEVTPLAVAAMTLTAAPAVSGAPFDLTVAVTVSGSPASGDVLLTVAGEPRTLTLDEGSASVSLIRAAGQTVVRAEFVADATTGASADLTIDVARRSQSVTFAALALTYGETVPVEASATSGLPVTFEASGACTLLDDDLVATGVGPCEVTATQAGDSETEPASARQAVDVAHRTQSVTLDPLPALVYGQTETLAPTSSLGLPVTLTAKGACTISGSGTTLRASGAGTCTVTASQPGDEVTAPASAVVRTTVVAKRPQTLTLSPLPTLSFGLLPLVVTAHSEFDLPVTLGASGACTLVEDSVVITGIGVCTVTATSPGDAVTLPATATVKAAVAAIPATMELSLGARLGDLVPGSAASASGAGLEPGSDLVVMVYSTPTEIARTVVGPAGTATVSGLLPVLEAGAHQLVVLGTGVDGDPVAWSIDFVVAGNGVAVQIGGQTLASSAGVESWTTGGSTSWATSRSWTSRGSLAATGADSGSAVALAALAVALGAAFVLLRRRLVKELT